MRIGIDARFFGPRTGGGGLGRYVSELVNNLQKIDHENEYVIFLKKENFHEFVVTGANFSKKMVDVPWYSLAEQTVMPREIAHAKVNFMHYSHWNVPVLSRVPFIVTIHDLILLDDPSSARATTRGPLVHGIKQLGHRLVLEKAIHGSRHIITVSEASRRSILGHFRVKPNKVSVIHNGVNAPLEGRGVSLRDLGVVEPFILYVGNMYPHKNLDTLLDAFAGAHARHPGIQLVMAGKFDEFGKKLEGRALEYGFGSGEVRFLNLPTDEELGALYRHAALLAYPSRIEGFGIPPVEALLAGTKVMASNASSMPEVLGDYVRYVDPDDTDDMAKVMLDAVERPEKWAGLKEKGADFAKRYSWEKAARQTLEIYLLYGQRRI
ncbi:MAG: glycosyltransferase family 1 protein [Patescibacteria group bacterium]|jgi:glycosyltransferase involved in cell wall biosynthesis